MINSDDNKSKRKKIQDPNKFKSFLEEMSWLLASYSNVDFKKMPDVINKYFTTVSKPGAAIGHYVSDNPNKHFLVGVLPRLFIDESLFSTNEDIAQFAKTVMKVNLQRYNKKSRYDLIGTIVCATNNLDDYELGELVRALDLLTKKSDKVKNLILRRRKENYGWNAIIQELARENINGQNSQRRF